MDFDLSLASVFLNGHLGTERLLQGVNCRLDVRIDNSRTVPRVILGPVGIPRNEHLRLSNGIISLDDPSGGVEYRIEVG